MCVVLFFACVSLSVMQFVRFPVEGFSSRSASPVDWQLQSADRTHMLLWHFGAMRGFIVAMLEGWKALRNVTFHADGAFFAAAKAELHSAEVPCDLYFAPVVQRPSNGDICSVPRLTLADLVFLGTVTTQVPLFLCPRGTVGAHHPPLVIPPPWSEEDSVVVQLRSAV